METWQRQHIRKNFSKLINLTYFTYEVTAELWANDVLSQNDVEDIEAKINQKGNSLASTYCYKLLLEQFGAYEALIRALERTNQTGALRILVLGRPNVNLLNDPMVPPIGTKTTPPVGTKMTPPVGTKNTPPVSTKMTPPVGTQTSAVAEKIKYFESEILGVGSGGTNVYKGTFGRRNVAVKVISNFKDDLEAENEIKHLLKCDTHANIVRYIHSEKKIHGFCIALELCEKFTLANWVADKSCLSIDIDPIQVLRQATKGLRYLHQPKINIIHRDLKPSNILFSIQGNDVVVKLSDFGISRTLNQGITNKTFTSFGGTFGWTAPEVLELKSTLQSTKRPKLAGTQLKMTNKIDIFSLGCIYYFVLTEGDHPFGDNDDLKNHRIKKEITQFKDKYDSLRLQCNLSLVKCMIAKDPQLRPNVAYILAHPIFWTHKKMIDFIDDVSNFVNKPTLTNQATVDSCVGKLETNYFPKISNGSSDGWFSSLDSKLKPFFLQRYKNHKSEAIKLVRTIRNFKHHYHETTFDQDVKARIGEIPDGFMRHWLKSFPTLINEMRDAFLDLKTEQPFKAYF